MSIHPDLARRLADENRWTLVREALTTSDLSDASRLAVIGCIVNSRQLVEDADIARTLELAERFRWEKNDGRTNTDG